VAILIMVISLIVKLIYGIIMKQRAKQLHSDALAISAVDSLGDALISAGILVAIVVIMLTGLDIEHYICILISLMILRTGIRMIRSSLTKIIGTSTDPVLRKKLLDLIIQEEGVLNVSGIVLHNYGEENNVGSVDIEVDEKKTAAEISRISRRIIRKGKEIGILITSVGITGTNITDPETAKVWDTIIALAKSHKSIRRLNSFVLDMERREISFYVIPDYNVKHQIRSKELEHFAEQVREAFPDLTVEILQGIDA
jgi:divalent metal cation (Fe/Co/Zn/Cd) transporter